MLKRHLRQTWDQLRGKKPRLDDFLDEVRILGLRGVGDLRIRLSYPVSVLAGPNASGKTTVLLAAACAYKVPGAGPRDFVPSTLFPDFRAKDETIPSDRRDEAGLEFSYVHEGESQRMRWRRSPGGWSRSYFGRKGATQPERDVYLRTLSNLSNPSEVRSFLQMGRDELDRDEITADLLAFAHRILPLRYRRLVRLHRPRKEILFAEREDGDLGYSEFHMSSGERAILRLSKDLSDLRDALVLIDEVEAGLHPFTQQQLMLELQRLALRNDLQILVTTHSPVVLECVPSEARIFLERGAEGVTVQPPYRDLIQNAFYGASLDKLRVLCEDTVAEALIRGVLDGLNPELNLDPSDLEVGRDTGKDEFPQHVRALGKFGHLQDFVFVLDGDAREVESAVRQAAVDTGQPIRLLFLPDDVSPEEWVWRRLRERFPSYADELGLPAERSKERLEQLDQSFAGATDKASQIAKRRLETFADLVERDVSEIARRVGRRESTDGRLAGFRDELREAIEAWRHTVQ